jgi:formylglycine-generating enzyme required for sulfatase activity
MKRRRKWLVVVALAYAAPVTALAAVYLWVDLRADAMAALATAPAAPPGGFAYVPAGSFVMGSPLWERGRNIDEGPRHRVTLTQPFWLAVREITNAEYLEFAAIAPAHQPAWMTPDGLKREDADRYRRLGEALTDPTHPVVGVSWFDAIAYANWRSDREGLTPCYSIAGTRVTWIASCAGYRLPTEAEWEYAARAGSSNGGAGRLVAVSATAWTAENSGGRTHAVGEKLPNAWGLYDMPGNVWEWVWDFFAPYPWAAQTDPIGPTGGNRRVNRGGSWEYDETGCRPANRGYYAPDHRRAEIGFRLARNVS